MCFFFYFKKPTPFKTNVTLENPNVEGEIGGFFIGMLALGREIASSGFSRLTENKTRPSKQDTPTIIFIHTQPLNGTLYMKQGRVNICKNIPGTQMTHVFIGNGLVLKGLSAQ